MVQIDALLFKKCRDGGKVRLMGIDVVFTGIIFEGSSRNDERRSGNYFVLTIRLCKY